MKIKLKIRQKILLYILSASALLYVVAIGYIVVDSRRGLLNESLNNSKLSTKLAASDVKLFFEKDLSLIRGLSNAFSIYNSMPTEKWQKLWVDMYVPVLKAHPHIYTLWDSWEMNSFVPGYDKPYGRIAHTVTRSGSEITWNRETRSLTGDPERYGNFKKDAIEAIWEPYYDEFIFGNMERRLMTSLGSPININGKFIGMVGVDLVLSTLQENIAKIKPFEGSVAFLVSNKSIIAAHPNKECIFKSLADLYKNDFKNEKLGERILKGEEFSYYHTDSLGNKYYVCYSPVNISNIPTPWALVISTPVKVLTQKADRSLYISIFVGMIGLLLIILVLIFVSDNLTRPIRKITSSLNRLANGEISDDLKIEINTGDEIEEMSRALNISVDGLNNKSLSAINIGKGQYDSEIALLSDKDMLGKSLIDMRDSLKKAYIEEEKRKVDDQKRTWANEGFAKFADILRQNNNDFQLLCDGVIKNLVKYLDANQGGIFLWNEEDKNDQYFELVATFAWDRKKYVTKRLEKGEGLVGACALEKETIFITDVPEDYVAITSGLGSANPRCVILVALKHENTVLGVIEMASFKVIEKYQIEFFEKVAESIASTILAVRINERTKALLEQSQQQAEEMAAQEEEMRQNMEELQATQEEAARKSGEIEGLLTSLNASSFIVEYDMSGTIINANDAFLQRLSITRQQLIGTHHSGNIEMSEKQKKEYGKFWDDLRAGKSKKVKSTITWEGNSLNLIETYFPVADGEGHTYKVMKLAHELDEFQ
ncbi:MAG: HAMP domain-containing protein [Bacteroidales bacterium]|nr:MAG: HAMP domain-containing protein [Bacteroidales bacterium]